MNADNSYWAATAPTAPSYAETSLPASVDVAVIGGGYTGLSAALHLAKAGTSVAVLERETMGWGASSRNGGMVLPGLKVGLSKLVSRYGLERARQMFAMSLEGIALVKTLIADEKIVCDLQETGELYAAWKPAHYQAIAGYVRLLNETFQHPVELIPPDRVRAELGTDRYHGGMVNKVAMGLHPAKYVAGLAGAAVRAGATLHENAGVRKLFRVSKGWELDTARGPLRADKVIVATDGYSDGLVPWLQRRVIPVGSYIIATEPLDTALAAELIPHRRMVFDSKNMLYYFRILPDNRMMFGGRASFTPTDTATSAAILHHGMVELFPLLDGVQVEYSWGGTLGFAYDLMPHAGERDGLYYSVGYAGHGVAMATLMGRKLAESIAADAPLPFSEIPFWGIPLYQGWPWFLPFAGAYYRFLDWVS